MQYMKVDQEEQPVRVLNASGESVQLLDNFFLLPPARLPQSPGLFIRHYRFIPPPPHIDVKHLRSLLPNLPCRFASVMRTAATLTTRQQGQRRTLPPTRGEPPPVVTCLTIQVGGVRGPAVSPGRPEQALSWPGGHRHCLLHFTW